MSSSAFLCFSLTLYPSLHKTQDLQPQENNFFPLDIPQPHTDPWSFSLELGLKLVDGSGCLLALGTGRNSSWLTLHLQDQVKEEGGMLAVFSRPWEK